jgi:hypothetical protein
VALAAMPSTQAVDVVEARMAAWQKLGLPRDLHVDHDPACRGSNRHPRSCGLLLRVCLYRRVAVHCIPEAEPLRHGIVERCTDVDDKLCFRPQPFRDLAHVREALPRVETFHNTQHRDAQLGSRTPWQVYTAAKRRLWSRRFALHRQGLLWREGRVACTRLPDDQGRVRFFSESFLVDPTLVHEYVRGTIDTKPGVLTCSHQRRAIRVYPYALTTP